MLYEFKTSYLTSLDEMQPNDNMVKKTKEKALVEFINELLKKGKLNINKYIKSYNSFTTRDMNNEEISEFIQQIEL